MGRPREAQHTTDLQPGWRKGDLRITERPPDTRTPVPVLKTETGERWEFREQRSPNPEQPDEAFWRRQDAHRPRGKPLAFRLGAGCSALGIGMGYWKEAGKSLRDGRVMTAMRPCSGLNCLQMQPPPFSLANTLGNRSRFIPACWPRSESGSIYLPM